MGRTFTVLCFIPLPHVGEFAPAVLIPEHWYHHFWCHVCRERISSPYGTKPSGGCLLKLQMQTTPPQLQLGCMSRKAKNKTSMGESDRTKYSPGYAKRIWSLILDKQQVKPRKLGILSGKLLLVIFSTEEGKPPALICSRHACKCSGK